MSRATAFAFAFKGLDGKDIRLSEHTGRPVLVVNTASLCGYTPQYSGLETLWARYRARGLLVIGVPSNDFGGQEPGGTSEIHGTAHRHGVTFPLTEKVAVKGEARSSILSLGRDPAAGRNAALELSQISGGSRRHPGGRVRLGGGTDRPARDHRNRTATATRMTRRRSRRDFAALSRNRPAFGANARVPTHFGVSTPPQITLIPDRHRYPCEDSLTLVAAQVFHAIPTSFGPLRSAFMRGFTMRHSFACAILVSASLAGGAAFAQTPGTPPAPAAAKCANPNALGVSRTVEIDTTGGPGFGFEHFKQHDFLRNNEVLLTFDDGPWPTTPKVLAALAEQCVKATFFIIGKHATYYPDILKQVAEGGHTIGSHTWSHADLGRKNITPEQAKEEIEKGISAINMSLGAQAAPFFRFVALRHPPELVTYLGERNIAIFSTDMDSFDFKARRPEQVVNAVMTKLKKFGKGIVLMHDFQTAHRGGGAGPAQAAQGRRLQDRAHEGQGHRPVDGQVRRVDEEGSQASDRRPASDRERGAHRRLNDA